jgi:hypothetical protein
MALGAMPAPQIEQPDPSIDGRSGGMPPKPNNSLELGQEPLSARPNDGPSLELDDLLTPQPMAAED